ncbi:hypothetical protein [Bosea sp. UC22_33]|uniref:hypothetical protein n=1 Tax=Bosea sp. UC22_33 TaxID=3350165 RepID=UPI00367079B3
MARGCETGAGAESIGAGWRAFWNISALATMASETMPKASRTSALPGRCPATRATRPSHQLLRRAA